MVCYWPINPLTRVISCYIPLINPTVNQLINQLSYHQSAINPIKSSFLVGKITFFYRASPCNHHHLAKDRHTTDGAREYYGRAAAVISVASRGAYTHVGMGQVTLYPIKLAEIYGCSSP